jgi:hypothetical protein
MTSDLPRIDVPICECVREARKRSTVFPIPSKYRTEGTATGSSSSVVRGCFVVRCEYCAEVLKVVQGCDFLKPAELYESNDTKASG